MGSGHGHDGHDDGHGHGHGPKALDAVNAGARYRRPLTYAFLLTVSLVGVEFAAGILSGSLALLSDAGHMLSDAGGLGMSLAAITLATAGTAAAHRTYGWYRLEILAALANTLLLFAVAGYVIYETLARLDSDHEVASTPMIVVAILGLVVNLIAFRLLAAGAKESLNLRGAYLEVVADAVGSVGVLIGAAIIALTSWYWVDSLIAIGIGIFILPRACKLGRDTLGGFWSSPPPPTSMSTTSPGRGPRPPRLDHHLGHGCGQRPPPGATRRRHALRPRPGPGGPPRPPQDQPRHRPGRTHQPHRVQPRPVVTARRPTDPRRDQQRPGHGLGHGRGAQEGAACPRGAGPPRRA